ncbi:MAG: hypothetical protein KAX49_19850 [Halanaerobiales bacterium]|nr:hypothetical protein [Halanaerobiales bacterium]
MSRVGFEFPNSVKDASRNRWHADHPGHDIDEPLEVDHIVSIWFAKKYGIPSALVKTMDNAIALRPEEHKQKHRDENEKEYFYLAYILLGWVRGLL